jgi:ferric hydroxamate transport system substrate-binding protein
VLTQSRAALDTARPAAGYRPVYVAQIVDDRHLRVFGSGSMFDEILQTLGLRNAAAPASSRGGSSLVAAQSAQEIVELDQLAQVPDACVLWVGSSAGGENGALRLNPVWRQLPFSQAGRSATLPVISATGALISVQRFARAVVGAMPAIHVL